MSSKRFFIIRAVQAKKARLQAANDTGTDAIMINGQRVTITDSNRIYAQRMIQRDAEQAFEAAVFHRPYESRVAMAA